MEASRPIAEPSPGGGDSDAYREHERSVLAMLASRYADLDPDGRRELYHEAWASVLKRRQQGTPIGSLRSYLLGAADKAASKRVYGADARRRITFDPRSAQLRSVPDPSGPPDEEVVAADEARRLRLLIQELDAREAAVLKLRIDEGLEPAEIRERLGLTERQYRRQAERAAQALTDEFAAFDRGDWARRKRSLLCACVMGVASERQQRKASELIAEDPLCRAMMSELRRVAGHVAAALPMPAVAAGGQLHDGGWAARVGDSMLAVRDKVSAVADRPPAGQSRPLRQRAAETLTDTKQHAISAYVRASDPTPLVGVRPGAAAAVLAGCLAASGGTYCAVEGFPQGVRAPFLAQDRPRHADAPKAAPTPRGAKEPPPASTPAAQSPAATSPPVAPSSASPTTPSAAPAPAQATPAPQSPTPTPTQEFEPSDSQVTSDGASAATGAGQETSTPSPSRATSPPTAKPAPASGDSGEFAP